MRNVRLYFVAFFVTICFNTFANDSLNRFCDVAKNAIPMINQERARLGLEPIEFKYILDKDEILVSYLYGFTSSAYYEFTSEKLFEFVKEMLNDELYKYAFVCYYDNIVHFHMVNDFILKEEFNRYVSSWYDKIFEHLDYSETFEAEVLRLVNIERTQRGLAPLKVHEDLQVTARIKAGEMYKYEYYGHGSLPGLPDEVVKRYYNIGENIAMGQTTPKEVVRDWMNSPGHRENILDSSYVYIGVGYCKDHWVQQFGNKKFIF
ncbi:MAG: hypothetical protein J6A44_00625 [Paludibacteraceae bacterium]|nr:hypothetical protein [Paludibacteraceae bacterium]